VAEVEEGSLDESTVNLALAETEEGTIQTTLNLAKSSPQSIDGSELCEICVFIFLYLQFTSLLKFKVPTSTRAEHKPSQ